MIKKKIAKKKTRSKLIKEADTLASLYVRQKNATPDGTVFCYTCNTPKHWKQIHCGHYVSRTFKYTRWELDNLRPQCYACNVLKKGMAHIFRQNLVEEIGEERVRSIETRAQVLFKEKDTWIEKKIAEFRELSTS
jgi:hypothetical protein